LAAGAQVRHVQANANDRYTFNNVEPGNYHVVAYFDQNRTAQQDHWEMAGALGRAALPQRLAAFTGDYTADVDTGRPWETEPNDGLTTNNRLLVGTFMNGEVIGANYDFFRLLIPAPGTYTMETFGEDCQSTNGRVDTVITLYDTSGTQLANNDDHSFPASLCSRIVHTFTEPGPYVLRVRGFGSSTGPYTVGIR
jgi:hypothetical protein